MVVSRHQGAGYNGLLEIRMVRRGTDIPSVAYDFGDCHPNTRQVYVDFQS